MDVSAPTQWWFTSLVGCELVLQLPFFFAAAYGIYTQAQWLRTPGIIYGTHVCTTLVPIIAELLFKPFAPGAGPQTMEERLTLIAIYSPYLILPLAFLIKCCLMTTQGKSKTS